MACVVIEGVQAETVAGRLPDQHLPAKLSHGPGLPNCRQLLGLSHFACLLGTLAKFLGTTSIGGGGGLRVVFTTYLCGRGRFSEGLR